MRSPNADMLLASSAPLPKHKHWAPFAMLIDPAYILRAGMLHALPGRPPLARPACARPGT